MKTKKITAFLLCFSILCSAGCSLGKGSSSGSSGGASLSSTTRKYELTDFSFELSEDFTVSKTIDKEDKSVHKYYFTGGGFDYLAVSVPEEYSTAETSIKSLCNIYGIDSGNENITDVEQEKLDYPGFNAASLSFTRKDSSGDKSNEGYLFLSTEGQSFEVEVKSSTDQRENANELMKNIAATAKYTGSYKLPTGTQNYDSRFMQISYDPKWTVIELNGTAKDQETLILNIRYAYAEDLSHSFYPYIKVDISPEGESRRPEELADDQYAHYQNSNLEHIGNERGTGEIFGCQSETVSSVVMIGSRKIDIKDYFFTRDGYIYCISAFSDITGGESGKDDINELIKGITLK
jgi:hypothetical protein